MNEATGGARVGSKGLLSLGPSAVRGERLGSQQVSSNWITKAPEPWAHPSGSDTTDLGWGQELCFEGLLWFW